MGRWCPLAGVEDFVQENGRKRRRIERFFLILAKH
jgi:hypothetical protein